MSVFFFRASFLCVYFLRGLGLMPICWLYKSAFFRTQLESHIYLDNTLKIRKPEIGIISYGEEGEGGGPREVSLDF